MSASHNYEASALGAVVGIRRARIEARIEELIALLDHLDGDPDIEANGDEHDVGVPEIWHSSANFGEPVLEDDEDGADDEPEETDENGDEQDSSRSEDDNIGGGVFILGRIEGGSGA